MRTRATLTILAVCLLGCAEDATLDRFELSGLVLDEQSSGPVSGARVVFQSDTLMVNETTTDDDGQYEMVILTDTPFGQVRAEREGFVTAETTVFFDSNERRIDLRLRPARDDP